MYDSEAGTSAAATDDFDVFLNHRGPDVKAGFVSHLEVALRRAGFRTFLDVHSLMEGSPALKSIDQALAVSKVHVAVVSRRYAESKHCLNELVAMMRSGKPVFPVFYDVEPGHLRSVEHGPFAEAFEKHKLRGRTQQELQEWRQALGALADITGFCMADYRQDEGMLMWAVVNEVSRHISNSDTPDRLRQVSDSVYLLCEPHGPPDMEIVFIHGLQPSEFNKAYWRTWIAGENDKDGREICWPRVWLREEFPRARILSLKYDLCVSRKNTTGTMDGFVGESLVQEMVEFANIGQRKNCPVMFVCHSIGGLVAKEMVTIAHKKYGKEPKYVTFLQNIRGFHFYATPHQGSKLADLAAHLPFMGEMVELLRVVNQEVGHSLNNEFERIVRDHYTKKWRFSVVAETHITTCYGFKAMVVEEASARHGYDKFLAVGADHFGVCKPRDKASSSYLALKNFIVEVVADNKQGRNALLELPRYVVGMDSLVKEVCGKWEGHSAVALVGIGGVGKTTLSKYIYNSEKDNFEGSCFLADVRPRGNIEACQRQLFHDLCGERWNENGSVDSHLEKIKECIMSEKVLLVVDDVDDKVNLRALQVPAFTDGKSGSKVIVTTRRPDILFDYVNKDGIVAMNVLSEAQALELFSHYAFNGVDESVRAQFGGQAKEIIWACGRLPLSLEILGQFFSSKWKDNYESIEKQMKICDEILQRLREAELFDGSSDDRQLRARLKISFDALTEVEQNIFLGISILCRSSLFREDSKMLCRDTLEQVWNSPISIQNLTDMSFIKWSGDENMLVIHDQFQAMAHQIVMDRAGGTISWMWDSDEGLKSLLKTVGEQEVLKLFHSTFSNTFPTSSTTPVGNSSLGTMLDLSHSEGLKSLPESIGRLQELQGVKLFQCNSLETLPVSMGMLSHLTMLDLSQCNKLSRLPDSIGGLKKLQELKLFHCDSLKGLPASTGNLSHLTLLDLSQCEKLTNLPNNIGGLKNLRVLKLYNCTSLERLPTTIGNLYLLTSLDLSFCEGLKSLPESIDGLGNLQVLKLYSCTSLETLPMSIGKLYLLTSLNLSYCQKLKNLPESIGKLPKLQVLDVYQCYSLEMLPASIGYLSLLNKLDLSYCQILKRLPESIGRLQNLQVLKLRGWYLLEELPTSICYLSLLSELDLSECYKLKNLPKNIGGLQNLQVFKLFQCTSLKSLPGSIEDLSLLIELDLLGCLQLKSSPEIARLKKLQILKLPDSMEQQKQVDTRKEQLKQVDTMKAQLKQVDTMKAQLKQVDTMKAQLKQVDTMKELQQDRRVDVEEEGGRRLRIGSKHLYNFLVVIFILLEPLLNTVGFLTNHGRFVLGLLMQWLYIPAGTFGQPVSSRYKCRVKSKDLILGRFLGQGCSGILYETTWSGSHENITGRLTRKLFPGVEGDVFESEVVRLFELTDHPNVVKTFSWTVDDRSCSLVMEYVSDNLSNVFQKKKEALRKEAASKQIVIGTRPTPFQFLEGLDIVHQIAMGVRHIHRQGLHHGDLKPNNVLIDWDGERMLVKLADFALVETKRRTTLISQRTLCSQMIAWSAPEFVKDYICSMSDDLDYLGTELDVDVSRVSYDKNRPKISVEKADSYSFALLCAYVFGGKVWDANLSPNKLWNQIPTSDLRPKLPSECPEALATLITLCWHAKPEQRPTFSDICDKLEEIVNDQQRGKKGKYLPEQAEETNSQRAGGEASTAEGRHDA